MGGWPERDTTVPSLNTRVHSSSLIEFLKSCYHVCMYVQLRWVSAALGRLSLAAVIRGCSSWRCAGFSLWWLLLLGSIGSRAHALSNCRSWALECRLNRCGARAKLLHGMWNLPGPGIKPVSPALAGRFLTTELPGRSCAILFEKSN